MSLDDAPYLLNWRKELRNGLVSLEIDIEKGDVVLMSTDSLARRIIYQLLIMDQVNTESILGESIIKNINKDLLEYIKINYLNLYNIKKFLDYCKRLIYSEIPTFQKILAKLIDNNELEKDDFSIIYIEV